MLALLLSLALVTAAPPPPPGLEHVARLQTLSAHATQAAWMAVKGLGQTKAELDAMAKRRLVASVCDDLVDLRDLSESGTLGKGFEFRDNVRGRSWARPSLALVLNEAMKALRAEMPDRTIAIGDVSQPGCGQVFHGVLVQMLRGAAAEDLLKRAAWELGQPALVEVKHGRDFPYEGDRFTGPDQAVRVATTVLGWTREDGDKTLVLKTGRARHGELAAASPEELTAFEAEVAKLARSGALVERRAIDVEGGKAVLSHWVLEASKRQLVVVSSKAPGKRIDFADVSEVRLADWQDKKPGSTPGEVIWQRGRQLAAVVTPPVAKGAKAPKTPKAKPLGAAAFAWTRWQQLYEAGHITHLSGIDADLSYVTVDNRSHFAVDLQAMDVQATFRWWEIVDETSRKLGTPVDAILVDPSVLRWVKKALPKKGPGAHAGSRVWRLLAQVGGHDGHYHLRIVEATPAQEKKARRGARPRQVVARARRGRRPSRLDDAAASRPGRTAPEPASATPLAGARAAGRPRCARRRRAAWRRRASGRRGAPAARRPRSPKTRASTPSEAATSSSSGRRAASGWVAPPRMQVTVRCSSGARPGKVEALKRMPMTSPSGLSCATSRPKPSGVAPSSAARRPRPTVTSAGGVAASAGWPTSAASAAGGSASTRRGALRRSPPASVTPGCSVGAGSSASAATGVARRMRSGPMAAASARGSVSRPSRKVVASVTSLAKTCTSGSSSAATTSPPSACMRGGSGFCTRRSLSGSDRRRERRSAGAERGTAWRLPSRQIQAWREAGLASMRSCSRCSAWMSDSSASESPRMLLGPLSNRKAP
ncbi:MAG: hypothetical protein U1F43_19760 [Myxococcota bacterium]